MKHLKENILVEQFEGLILSSVTNGGIPDEDSLTRRLYRYLQEECDFGKGLTKEEFYEFYFKNPIAEHNLFSAFNTSILNYHPENGETYWFYGDNRTKKINARFAELIEKYQDVFDILEDLIEKTQIEQALGLFSKTGLFVDLDEEEVKIRDSCWVNSTNILKMKVAAAILKKYQYLFSKYPLKIASIRDASIVESNEQDEDKIREDRLNEIERVTKDHPVHAS